MKDEKQRAAAIRGNYEDKQPSKIDELRKLDGKVKRPADVTAYVLGVIASLVLGTGMCLAMNVIGNLPAVGIVIGVVGIALMVANYFIYKAILKARKKKYGAQILKLSDEIINA